MVRSGDSVAGFADLVVPSEDDVRRSELEEKYVAAAVGSNRKDGDGTVGSRQSLRDPTLTEEPHDFLWRVHRIPVVEVHAREASALAQEVAVVAGQWLRDDCGNRLDAGRGGPTLEGRLVHGITEVAIRDPGAKRLQVAKQSVDTNGRAGDHRATVFVSGRVAAAHVADDRRDGRRVVRGILSSADIRVVT